ncbi:unnamed protein product [Periconia digitata]|uniref:CAP-Gly domain-containing protein n=1 Tax=Periconia digitata TaxID=1303443 RepID=A0A9W4UAK5_9PLEO|nr:unnamed protein product [Periconia digitata]
MFVMHVCNYGRILASPPKVLDNIVWMHACRCEWLPTSSSSQRAARATYCTIPYRNNKHVPLSLTSSPSTTKNRNHLRHHGSRVAPLTSAIVTHMSLQAAADVALLVTSANSSSERRVSPAWTLAHFKTRLEPITGIPASCQQLTLRINSQDPVSISAVDEEQTQLAAFPLQPYAELVVADTRPPSARPNFSDLSAVEKYEMPSAEYESRSDSVLAWKKAQKLGRFDPNAPTIEQQKVLASEREIQERGLTIQCRVRLLPESDARRGTVMYLGLVPEIPGIGFWVGVALDEPTGKNDGSVKGKRYFDCGSNYGVFVRPERCESGEFPPLDLGDEDMEEL